VGKESLPALQTLSIEGRRASEVRVMFALRQRQRLGSESVAGVAIERLSDADREARPEEKNPTKEAHNPHQALKKTSVFHRSMR
jgi:hypothetical protein